jgi:hypothetical protein
LRAALRIDDRNGEAFAAEQERAGWNAQARRGCRQGQRNLGIGAGPHQAGAVVEAQLDQHGAGVRVHRIRRANNIGAEDLVRMVRHAEVRDEARWEGGGIALRHIDVEPQFAGVGDREQGRRTGVSGHDQLTDVGGPAGDDAVERRDDPLEVGQRLEAADVGAGFILHRRARGQVAVALIDFLLRDRVRDDKPIPALGRDARQASVRVGGRQRRARGDELLIDVRRIDLGQQLSGADMVADVDVPVAQITVGPGVDRSLRPGFEPARQHDRPRLRRLRPDHRHRGNLGVEADGAQLRAGGHPAPDADGDHQRREAGADQEPDGAPPSPHFGGLAAGRRIGGLGLQV